MTIGEFRKQFVQDAMSSNLFRAALLKAGFLEAAEDTEHDDLELTKEELSNIREGLLTEFRQWER